MRPEEAMSSQGTVVKWKLESIVKHQRNVGFILHTLVSEKHKINEMRSHKEVPRLVKPK